MNILATPTVKCQPGSTSAFPCKETRSGLTAFSKSMTEKERAIIPTM